MKFSGRDENEEKLLRGMKTYRNFKRGENEHIFLGPMKTSKIFERDNSE